MKQRISVLICDDHPAVRYGLRSILQLNPKISIAGEAENGTEARRIISRRKVDLLILDIQIPQQDSIGIAGHLLRENSKLKVLIFSIYNDANIVINALKAGVNGYLLKSANENEIMEAIEAVFNGKKYLSKELADQKILENIADDEKVVKQPLLSEILSARELDVLKLLATESSYSHIADKLKISKRTVDTHRYNISKKLGINSLSGLIRYAISNGIA